MRYRIHVDSPRHRVHDEYFVEFRRTDLGAESVHTEPDRATWLDLNTAQIALRRLRAPEYRIRCRLLDEFGSVRDAFSDGARDPRESLTLQTAHENSVWRERFEGRLIELPLIHNKVTDTWYLKLSTSSNPNDPPDLSISGPTPAAVFDRFVSNPCWRQYQDRFVVEDIKPEQTAVAQPTASVPTITIPKGSVVAGYRPGNRR